MEQNISYENENTVFNECLSIFDDLLVLEDVIRKLEYKMGSEDISDDERNEIYEEYEKKRKYFEDAGGYSYNSKIKGVLNGLGFTELDYDKEINQLSGGQKSRIHLAKLLLKPTELMLLDEPTNHLDMESIRFLESYLRDYKGSYIIVSHDRYFLNEVCNRIFLVQNKKLKAYDCKYNEYVLRKEKDSEIELHLFNKQQKEINRQMEIIQRFENYGNKRYVRQASSRKKLLDKIEVIENPIIHKRNMKLNLMPEVESGRDVLSINGLSMSFNDKELFKNLELNVYKGDKIGIVGKNGVGKTTLFKILCNKINPTDGEFKLGSKVFIGYYDQEQKSLDDSKELIDEFWDEYPKMDNFSVRTHLAKFNFIGEDLFKTVGNLSGGERARLELSKLMISKSNFLLLDEPTNHLDIESKEILENALSNYEGTFLTVSHDRYFLNKIANKIWYMTDSGVKEYYGNYDYFLAKINEKESVEIETISKTEIEKEKRRKKEQEREKKQKIKEAKKLEELIYNIEEEIENINKRIQNNDFFDNKNKMLEEYKRLSQLTSRRDELYKQWENLI